MFLSGKQWRPWWDAASGSALFAYIIGTFLYSLHMRRLPWTFVVCLFSCSIIRSSIIFYISYEMASHVRSSIFIASHMWTPKTHARLCIRTVSQSPSMLAHIKYRTRRRFWTDIKLDGWACSFEDSRDGGQKVPKPRVMAHTCMSQTEDSAYTRKTLVLIHASVGSCWTIFQQ